MARRSGRRRERRIKCDAFITRVRELLDGELSPAKVDQLTARIRGRTRRPSDVKLPNAITERCHALTDVDDLCVGLVSDDLQDKMVAVENERTSSDKTFEAELSELKEVSTGESERELTPTERDFVSRGHARCHRCRFNQRKSRVD